MFNFKLKIVGVLILFCTIGSLWDVPVVNAQEEKASQKKQVANDGQDKAKPKAKSADKKSKTGKTFQQRSAEEKAQFMSLSEERKKELLEFVAENHTELKDLLKRLQSKRPRLFHMAVNSLDRDVTKLQNLKKRSPLRYGLALEEWNLKSRIEVLTAQLAIEDSKEKRTQLRTLVNDMYDLNLQKRELDRDQLAKRLETLDKRIVNLKSNREATIERQIKAVEKKTKDLLRSSSKKASKENETVD